MSVFRPGEGWKPSDYKMVETYKGCVLDLSAESSCGDSDYIAIVWDEEKQSIRHICYDTTRAYSVGSAKVDATPEVLEKAKKYMYKQRLEWWQERNKEQSRVPEVGREVEVIEGGYTNEEGVVFWKGISKYSPRYFGRLRGMGDARVGVQTKNAGRIFVKVEDVEVINPERYEKPISEGEDYANGCTGACERWERG